MHIWEYRSLGARVSCYGGWAHTGGGCWLMGRLVCIYVYIGIYYSELCVSSCAMYGLAIRLGVA